MRIPLRDVGPREGLDMSCVKISTGPQSLDWTSSGVVARRSGETFRSTSPACDHPYHVEMFPFFRCSMRQTSSSFFVGCFCNKWQDRLRSSALTSLRINIGSYELFHGNSPNISWKLNYFVLQQARRERDWRAIHRTYQGSSKRAHHGRCILQSTCNSKPLSIVC